jgi:hypothetical protein
MADRGPMMIPSTQTSSESTTSTTGIDKAGATKIEGATQQANDAATAAGRASIDQTNAGARLDQSQSQAAYGRGVQTYFESLGELQTQQEVERETTERLSQAAAFRPDRTELFQGDRGVLFGISAAISAMAGGWLMGQGLTGGKNPYLDSVLRMIDDNANDQIDQNSRVVQELTRRLGSAQAAKKELKARMLGAVNDTIEAQSRFEKAELVQKGSATTMAQVAAEQAKNNLESAKLTAQTVTKSRQTRSQTAMIANPAITGGLDINDPKIIERVGKVGALENLETEAKGLSRSGAIAGSVGLVDEAVDSVKGWFNAKDVPEQRVQALRAKWELIQRANWASEPNGQAVQERLSSISFPQNDAGIPMFLQAVRETLNQADPGGRYRQISRAMGETPNAVETRRTPVVR